MKVLIEFDDSDRELLYRGPQQLPTPNAKYLLAEATLSAWMVRAAYKSIEAPAVLDVVMKCNQWQFFNERPGPDQKIAPRELPSPKGDVIDVETTET